MDDAVSAYYAYAFASSHVQFQLLYSWASLLMFQQNHKILLMRVGTTLRQCQDLYGGRVEPMQVPGKYRQCLTKLDFTAIDFSAELDRRVRAAKESNISQSLRLVFNLQTLRVISEMWYYEVDLLLLSYVQGTAGTVEKNRYVLIKEKKYNRDGIQPQQVRSQ
ncbi:hypothetical protein CHS0354_013763 [Potamilus streckersoni]|uniref:Uncharacterized protein n=1 Tax=Potamilus streckersoni TaxID=2493646 RepID=A0AAE0SH41_9BIVA|nr:hypothetical protein CHS0354_013763 [Potamilus streckersoni]